MYAQGRGDIRIQRKPLGTSSGMGRWSRPAGRGAGVRATEAGRGRKGTLDGRTLGADRDLGAGQGRKRGGKTDKGRQS